jgi:hypothetical protein
MYYLSFHVEKKTSDRSLSKLALAALKNSAQTGYLRG